MTSAVIVAAARTAIGSFGGGLSSVPAHQLGAVVMRELLARSNIAPDQVGDVLMGQVLTAAQGQNPARQAAIGAGMPPTVTAMTLNQVCGSGLRAVALAAQAIQCGDAEIVIAGGQESMSLAPHSIVLRNGVKMGAAGLTDTMVHDGLWDIFNDFHMGHTAERVAMQYGISREAQDTFALSSQRKAAAAIAADRFSDEIVPVVVRSRKGEVVVRSDEHPRPETTLDALAKLRPAFVNDGTVTPGNASGINDGAAALLLMDEKCAAAKNLRPLGRIVSWATCGVDPAIMGIGPISASRKAMDKVGWKVSDLDLIEANEAFAAQAIAVNQAMGWDTDKVNVNGGAIALGHPIGASGARILVTLVQEMKRRRAKRGVATLCIGGGMGIALCVEGC